ncbi:MAG TPA: PDZ domain-containing protein [Chitinophagaceae bacterium]|nr:PDZ domain-containing protein [Chitinophagaceae bacterium]
MKQYFSKLAATLLLACVVTAGFAQDNKKEDEEIKEKTRIRKSEDVIVITPKVNVDTKLTIEIKGDDIKVNGKPLSEFKNDDVNISRRKHLDVSVENRRLADLGDMRPPVTRFRNGGGSMYGFGNGDSFSYSTNSNKAFLGVGTEKDDEGVSITSVSKGSGAEKAGLKEDDIITKINDDKISSPDELTKTIGKYKPEDKITITYKRDKKEMKTTATLGKRKTATTIYAPEAMDAFRNLNFDNGNYNFSWNGRGRLGLKAQETEDGKGLKIVDIDEGSTAEKAGLKEGDIITSFDGAEVNNVEKLGELARTAMEKGNFKVKLLRDGKQQEVDVKIPKKLKTTSL